jgi:hypothetical protein
MENDEKTPSHGDETLPTNEDEQPSPDTIPETLAADAAQPENPAGTSNAVIFPGPARWRDDNFGMPGYLAETGSGDKRDDGKAAGSDAFPEFSDLPGGETTAGLPLNEDTGWESVGSISKPSSLRARIEAQDAGEILVGDLLDSSDDDAVPEPKPAPSRHEAKVTPFPGTVVNRMAEPAPSELLRSNISAANVFDDITARPGDEPGQTSLEAPASQDALADAVQSALRNIYGGYAEQQEEPVDLGNYTVADVLARVDAAADEPIWSEQNGPSIGNWRAARAQDYDVERDNSDDADTEGVLDYLYNQRRQERPSPDMSLSDYAARAATLGDAWQGKLEQDEEQPRVMPFPIRERADAHRARGQDFLNSAEPSIIRGGFFPGGEPPATSLEPDWRQQPFVTPQNTRGAITPTFAPAVAATDQLTSGGPDSGHLLGAAGLGLIGGIALAGVLAVFVFNSFVDESGQGISDSGAKVVERLATPAAPSPAETRSAPENRTEALPPVQSAANAPLDSAPPANAEPAPPPEAPKPKITAAAASGTPDNPIRLNIALANAEAGESLVSLKGLPKDAKLSTGIDVGGGQWLLPPGRLKDLTVLAPGRATGTYQLEAQLLKDDAQTSISDAVPFTLNIAPPPPRTATGQGQAGPNTAKAGAGQGAPGNAKSGGNQAQANAAGAQGKPDTSRQALLPDEAPLPETDFLTQMLIRDGNKKMREGDIAAARRLYDQAAQSGNAEAALAMGRSYDPTYFEKLNVKTGKPDPATAFEWYKRALDGGLVTAKVKIDTLKQWLQR